MRGLWKLMWVEAKLFSREPMLGFFTLVFPLIVLFCFGGLLPKRLVPISRHSAAAVKGGRPRQGRDSRSAVLAAGFAALSVT